jgi:hypothetical protein
MNKIYPLLRFFRIAIDCGRVDARGDGVRVEYARGERPLSFSDAGMVYT